MANILITGAHGFIGKHLARFLAKRGHHVSGLGHGMWPQNEASRWGLRDWLNGDVHVTNLRALQTRNKPDYVFHLAGGSSVGAAISNPREDFFRTVGTTIELLEWLRLDLPRARLIAVSSAAVYGSGLSGQIGEGIVGAPYSPYGHHKRMMEYLCISYGDAYGLDFCVTRLFSVYGAGLKKQLLWDICTQLHGVGGSVLLGGTGEELRDWTHVDDVVAALAVIAFNTPSPVNDPVFNIGTGIGTSVKDVAEIIINAWCRRNNVNAMPRLQFSSESRPGDPFSLVANPSRLLDMDFVCDTPLSIGVDEYVDWFFQNNDC
ncbi:MAG: SDR family oxidoreductase [Alphaproteobacteria bacterium]|nr:SDR family oxidoreductase [Alphaproteobacteria bacterium]